MRLGFYWVWRVNPSTLQFGVYTAASTTIDYGFGELFLKGVTYFLIMI